MYKQRVGRALAVTALVMAGLVACQSPAATSQAETVNVKRGDITRSVRADGRMAFIDHQGLAFGTMSKVTQVTVNELDRVSRGQVLARLDTTDLEQAVKAAELAVTTTEVAAKLAQVSRQQAEYGVRSAEADLNTVRTNVKSAGIDLDQATDNFRKITYPYTYSTFVFDVPQALALMGDAKRQISDASAGLETGLPADRYSEASRQLRDALDNLTKGQQLLGRGQGQDVFQSGLLNVRDFWTLRAAQQQMDKAQLAVENAQNSANKTALAIDNTRAVLNAAQLAVDKANNDISVARNNLTGARNQLDKAVITAPFDAIAASVNVKVGDVMSAINYNMIAVDLVNPARLELDIRVGQRVAISVDALPGAQFEGAVTSVGALPVVDPSGSVFYTVKTVLNVPPGSALKAGMAATASITIDKRGNVLFVPNWAVKKDSQGKTVVNVMVNGQVQVAPVVVGISNGQQTEIVSGLNEGQAVVVDDRALSLDGRLR